MPSLPEWGDDPGRRTVVHFRCPNPDCPDREDDERACWTSPAIRQYGTLDVAYPDCRACGTPGEGDE